MATGYVAEFIDAATFAGGAIQAPRGLPKKVQMVDFSGGSTACSDALDKSTGLVGLFVDTIATFAGGATPTADVESCPLGAEQWYFYVPTGAPDKIAFFDRTA